MLESGRHSRAPPGRVHAAEGVRVDRGVGIGRQQPDIADPANMSMRGEGWGSDYAPEEESHVN